MDSSAMRAMRDSMAAMRERGDTAGIRAMSARMGAAAGGPGGPRVRGARADRGGQSGDGELNLRPAEAPLRAGAGGGPGAAGGAGGGGGGGGFGGPRNGTFVAEGDYLVTITAGGQTMRRTVHVERTGQLPPDPFPESEEEER